MRGFLINQLFMKELTYILGAGASFQSIPIVKTFSNRFNEFLTWIENDIIKANGFSADEKQKFGILLDLGKRLHSSFESHQSFDTYFKKLFHTGQKPKISEDKKVLNLYFIWEHLSVAVPKPDKYDDFKFWKQSVIDKRYDALIAGFLQPLANEKVPYCKINFITWNYDLNLFMSLKNYFSPNTKIGDFFDEINKRNGVWEIQNEITVINMNGFFYSTEFAVLSTLDYPNIHQIIYSKIKDESYFKSLNTGSFRYSASDQDEDAELIKFAWENDKLAEGMFPQQVILANNKIASSENIIIIGYTFPLYNRLLDLACLEQKYIGSTRIVIQDPSAEIIRQNLLDYYQLSDNDALRKNVKTIKDCESFYIPSNIFGISEYRKKFDAARY